MQLTDIILKKNVLLGSSSKKTNAKSQPKAGPSRRRQNSRMNLDDDPMNYNYDIRPERSYDGLVTVQFTNQSQCCWVRFLVGLEP